MSMSMTGKGKKNMEKVTGDGSVAGPLGKHKRKEMREGFVKPPAVLSQPTRG